MYYNKVEICGIDTTKLKVMKEKEKIELLKKVRDGDTEARESLINGNLRLVLSVIQRFSSRGENSDDLFQVGCIGLIKAIDNLDISQTVRFATYAVPMRCTLGKKKGETPLKWLKTKQYQCFRDFQHHQFKAVLTSAKEIKRTKIGKLRLATQSGLIRQ